MKLLTKRIKAQTRRPITSSRSWRVNRIAYVYTVKVNGVVRIIGKGSENTKRIDHYLRLLRKLARGEPVKQVRVAERKLFDAYMAGAKITTEYVAQEITHKQALKQEELLIADYNILLPGQLWNMHPGGGGFDPSNYTETQLEELRLIGIAANEKRWNRPGAREEHAAKGIGCTARLLQRPGKVCSPPKAHAGTLRA